MLQNQSGWKQRGSSSQNLETKTKMGRWTERRPETGSYPMTTIMPRPRPNIWSMSQMQTRYAQERFQMISYFNRNENFASCLICWILEGNETACLQAHIKLLSVLTYTSLFECVFHRATKYWVNGRFVSYCGGNVTHNELIKPRKINKCRSGRTFFSNHLAPDACAMSAVASQPSSVPSAARL